MTSGGEDGNEGKGPSTEGGFGERFADLVSDTKPLDRGPARVDQPRRDLQQRARTRDRLTSNSGKSSARDFRWPDADDLFRACAAGVNDRTLNALARGEPEPEERIDLHGVRRDAGRRLLTKRLASARAEGLACVLVIHGQGQRSASGEAVLRDALPDWLTQGEAAPHVLAFAPAPNRLGGRGATLVLLRR